MFMKKRINFIITMLFSAVFLCFSLAFPEDVAFSVSESINLCIKNVIPSLFPFFILSSVMSDQGISCFLGNKFRRSMPRVFKVGGSCATPVIIGLMSGYPIGAASAVSLYKNGLCTKKEAEHLLGFAATAAPDLS